MKEVIIFIVIVTASSGETETETEEAAVAKVPKFIYYRDMFLSSVAIFSYVLIAISSYLCDDDASTFFLCLLLATTLAFILYPQSPNIHPHF